MAFDLDYQIEPVCPYCGKKEGDAWELPFSGMEDDIDADCGHCGKTYRVERHVSISYSTRPLEDAKEADDAKKS